MTCASRTFFLLALRQLREGLSRGCVRRIDLERGTHGLDRLGDEPLPRQDRVGVVDEVRLVRLPLDRHLQGLVELAQFGERDTQAVVRRRLARSEPNRFPKVRDRFAIAPAIGQRDREVGVRRCVAGLESQRLCVWQGPLCRHGHPANTDSIRTGIPRRLERVLPDVRALPLDAGSTFIRSSGGGAFGRGGRFVNSLGPIAAETTDIVEP